MNYDIKSKLLAKNSTLGFSKKTSLKRLIELWNITESQMATIENYNIRSMILCTLENRQINFDNFINKTEKAV